MVQKSGKTIGIDIGDTYFRISYLENGIPRLVSDSAGVTCFPSKVSFLQGGGCQVGVDAEMFGVPENTVQSPMTIIGAPFSELKLLNSRNVYQFIREDGQIVIDAHRVFPTVPDVLIAIFAHAKKLAENHLGSPVSSAVIAIPDGASDPKKILIKKAAEDAGLVVKQLLNQTVSAALGYRFDLGNERKQIAVVDVGASHSTCAILYGGKDRLEMINTGHCNTGANALEYRLAELISAKVLEQYAVDMFRGENNFLKQELFTETAYAIKDLSEKEETEVSIGCALPTGGRAIVTVKRKEFYVKINAELMKIGRALQSAYSSSSPFAGAVLLIGGGGNIPAIKELVDQVFSKPPFLSTSINSAEAVALGAAIKGGIIDGIITSQSVERTVHDLGTFYRGVLMDVLIPKGTIIPVQVAKTYQMNSGPFREKVYQWIGPGSGQDIPETHPDVITLVNEEIILEGNRGVRCTMGIDSNGIGTFIDTDLGTKKQYVLSNFTIQ